MGVYFIMTKSDTKKINKEIMSPVQGSWFTEIASGRKTVEGRAGEEGKYNDFIGLVVPLRGNDNGKLTYAIWVKIIAVRHYPDLSSYIAAEGYQRIPPQCNSNEEAQEAYLKIMMNRNIQVFSEKRVKARGGINAIELEVIEEDEG